MSTLLIELPLGGWVREKTYAVESVFGDLLRVPVEILQGESKNWRITYGSKYFELPNLFFPEDDPERYLTKESLPTLPLTTLQSQDLGISSVVLDEQSIPLLWSLPTPSAIEDIDLFGSIFFLLSRYEEAVSSIRDTHDRFPSTASIALKAGFLHRPLADEYACLLWACVLNIAPDLVRPPVEFRFLPTHDVDIPISLSRVTPLAIAKRLMADLLKRHSLAAARFTWNVYRDWKQDPRFTFDWIMSVSEQHGFVSTFNFVADATDRRDPGYDLMHPSMRKLMAEILRRGHEIGLHGSYGSFVDCAQLSKEKKLLEQASGVAVSWGRQHYLHFSIPESWRTWAEAGFAEDSSLGFADHVGFRCGTAKAYRAFDVLKGEVLAIRERPLVAMEVSLLDSDYQGLHHEGAFGVLIALIKKVRHFGGEFILLWHNDRLISLQERSLYLRFLAYVANSNN
jgi:peptidoglycan/xylan/chitin deacetylase (PgdA/CDA1 family)